EAGYIFCGSADEAIPALSLLEAAQPDLAILDINLIGEKDGIWLAEQINETLKIPFIFLTSLGDKSSVERAVRTRPYGYLLKPFDDADVFDAIHIALNNFSKNKAAELPDNTKKQEALAESLAIKDSIFIKHNNLFTKVNFKDILYVEADKNYIDIFTDARKFTMRTSLKDMAANLPKGSFIQVNRSCLINLEKIESFGKDVVNIKQHELSLSENFKEEFLRKVKTYRD
ncbi:MAG: response regulator transcription factor, partial [Bacteroidia bacterium]|nr:response regulator transcription factor [Bacteroidia bacterium]